jgi:hypothetical protein
MQRTLRAAPADSQSTTPAGDHLVGQRYQEFRRALLSRLCDGLVAGRMENCRGLLQALVLYPPVHQPMAEVRVSPR